MFWDTVMSSWAFQSYNSNPSVKNLEVTFDSSMKFDEQIESVAKTSFFQLCVLKPSF